MLRLQVSQKKTFGGRKEISKRMTTTQKKINVDSVTAQALFKAVTQVTNEINDAMFKIIGREIILSNCLRKLQNSTCLAPGIESLRILKALIHSRIGQT